MKRGEVYYIQKGAFDAIDSEIQSGRPGIIVSNDKCNNSSGVVEVVYLTTQPKTELPTHTTIESSQKESTALCEQIQSIAVSRIGDYMCTLSEGEMKAVDNALLISLALDKPISVERSDEIVRLKVERDTYEKILDKFLKGQVK